MVYVIKHNKKYLRLGKGADGFATKKEAILVRKVVKKRHPRMKNIRIVKVKKVKRG